MAENFRGLAEMFQVTGHEIEESRSLRGAWAGVIRSTVTWWRVHQPSEPLQWSSVPMNPPFTSYNDGTTVEDYFPPGYTPAEWADLQVSEGL